MNEVSIALQRVPCRKVLNAEWISQSTAAAGIRLTTATSYRQYNHLKAGVRRVKPSCLVVRYTYAANNRNKWQLLLNGRHTNALSFTVYQQYNCWFRNENVEGCSVVINVSFISVLMKHTLYVWTETLHQFELQQNNANYQKYMFWHISISTPHFSNIPWRNIN